MGRQTRNSGPKSRSSKSKDEDRKYQILVFAEGISTECTYLNDWHRRYRDKVAVIIADHAGSAPMSVVRAACLRKKSDFRKAHREGRPYDEYWCVIDVDEHENLAEALQMAKDNGIYVALSNPCLEVWFLLHFYDQTKYLDRHEAQRLAYDHLGCTKSQFNQKHMPILHNAHELATTRAVALDKKHYGDGTPRPCNPSSNIWELTEIIRKGRRLPLTP
ncbi:RloB family protein [Nocardia sp. NPDC058705]|uniref:RloB family protein n=1 Tax=Nocardia sp. NPDC058705 TaxID=3346609 RepID=UPI00367F8498